MRDNTVEDVTHEGNLGGSRVLMRFAADAAGRAHIMRLLTDAYSDKEGTVIRELACNGLDSQIEAGYDGPLEVTTPTSLMPYLIIEDHGTGMSVNFINGTFSEFGGSTKRDTNDQVGFWGIGSKSPLTLTKQFTFYTVHNGVKSTVLVSRDEVGAAGIEIIDTVSTNEPNGTRFKIPIDNPQYVTKKVHAFFKWWPEDSVLIDGQPPQRPQPEQVLDPLIEVHTGLHNDLVIMGNIAYPVSQEHRLSQHLTVGYNVVVRVPMGEVSITPNREALVYNDLTLETLDLARRWINETMARAFRAQVEACPTLMDAWKKRHDINSKLINGITDFYWRGIPVPGTNAHVEVPTPPDDVPAKEWDGRFVWSFLRNRSTRASRVTTGRVYARHMDGAWVVENYPNKTVSAYAQSKIMRWQEEKGVHGYTMVLIDPGAGRFSRWVPPERTVDWEEIDKYKAVVKKSPKDAPTYTFQHWDRKQRKRVFEPSSPHVPKKGRLIYYSPSDDVVSRDDKYAQEMVGQYLCKLFPKAHVVSLSYNRHDKFRRENKRAKHVHEILKEFEHKLDNLDDHTQFMLAGGGRFKTAGLGRLFQYRDDVLDKDIVEVLDFMRSIDKRLYEQYDTYKTLCYRVGRASREVRMPVRFRERYDEVGKRYAVRHLSCSAEELLECVNALYLYRNPTTPKGN